MRLAMMTKDPGPGGLRLSPTALDIRFEKTFGMRFPDAYERLLMDTVRGNATLFMRRDEVEAAWALGGADPGGLEQSGPTSRGRIPPAPGVLPRRSP